MYEAIQLAGIFINYGAVCLIDAQDGEVTTLKDMNRGTIYDDPLVVLINQGSASASELFAAAMQDQNRGLIVGARSFGKSSAQNIMPLPGTAASLKITVSKFYRVTGKSHQGEGVIPDVVIPSWYDYLKIGEGYDINALENSTVDKKVYYFPKDSLPKENLRQRSAQRIATNPVFIEIEELSKRFAEYLDGKATPVSFNEFKTFYERYVDVDYDFDQTDHATYSVKNPSYIRGVSSSYDSSSEIYQDSMDEIKGDPIIQESFNILEDLIAQ